MPGYTLSNPRLRLEFAADGDRLRLRDSSGIATAGSGLFALHVDGQRLDAGSLAFAGWHIEAADGQQHAVARFSGAGIALDYHLILYDDTALVECWQEIRAVDAAVHVTRIDSISLDLAPADYTLHYFTSDWGQEFEPVSRPLDAEIVLETRAGRSSKGQHPWFALERPDGGGLAGAVAWSGNWALRFEPLGDGTFRLDGGLHDWEFAKDLHPGETMESPHIVLALGSDQDDAAQQFARVGRRWWYPHSPLSDSLPVEWNHWWSYEDIDISEGVFLENAAASVPLGVEVCTLDAGWFGGAQWYPFRGDWDEVNTERFPGGIRALADAVHGRGLKFGIWCEIEGLGAQANLAHTRPEVVASRDGAPLGYVCLGSPQAREWAYQTLRRLIVDYQADWIKLDFNLDPGAGCSRTDHGHGAGDGLYEHYRGYYALLDRVRAEFPGVVLENCASGGQRIDLGILRHTHVTFLSDADWPVHNLQVFWGATQMLAPNACLRWSFSEWRPGNGPAQQNFNPHDPSLTRDQFDYYTRMAMLGSFGLSQKLPLLPAWVADRLAQHIAIYRNHVRRFVREGELYHLTAQPRRGGSGDHWAAFQYALVDEHLLFVFRLPGAEPQRAIRLKGLDAGQVYRIEGFEGEAFAPMSGEAIMREGLIFSGLPEAGSALLRVY